MWKFKKDANGNIVLDKDGNPIVIKPDGTEISYDIAQTTTTIANLQNEAKTHREAKEAAERSLQAFAGIDPVAAKKAINDLKDVDLTKMVNASKLDEVRAEVSKGFETKIADADKKFADLQKSYHKTVRENAFRSSKFITDKLIVPPDMVMATFGDRFEVDDTTGKLTAKVNGLPMSSPDRPGEVATMDEALQIMIKDYPFRDQIMKGNNQSGSGSNGGNGGGGSGGKQRYTRTEFDKLDAGTKMKVATDKTKYEIVDD